MEHHDAAFWDAEYASGALGERAFDWLFDFAELGEARWRALLGPAGGRVAVVGCGHASLSAAVAALGYDTVSMDSSATVIAAMRAAHPALAWEACLDAVLCYADASAADACVASYARALRPGGRLVVFACAREHGGADNDGYGGGAPRALALVETRFRDVAVEELAASRSIAPTYDDVRPTHYAQIVARAPADPTEAPPPPPAAPPPREPHIDDYDAYYSGALTDGPPDPHDAFCSWAALAPKFAAAVAPLCARPRVLEVGHGLSDVGAGLAAVADYCGVDAVPACVDLQRSRFPDLRLAVADARELGAADGFLARAWGEPHADVIFDKGTFDALFLYADPDRAVRAYLRGARRLLAARRGVLVVVGCARTDGILQGTGAPRLRGFLDAGGWRVDAQEEILSDVGAGERTFDWIVAAPPPD
ncbi:methyltransferase [Aureococcus anophagefferens]|uniref:Methyltransferase n=1 Tax=Aureococcus anophagefferens TaxID=44056 RepID=A0ABR1G149_AURAN